MRDSFVARKALLLPGLAVIAATLAACGTGGTSDAGGTAPPTRPSAVSTLDHPELGPILVDSTGRTLYFAIQEERGTIQCVDECLGFWFPVAPPAHAAPTVPGMSGLGVLHRDDGRAQVTYQGRPLYTFRLDDKRGDISGNNLSDAFDGTYFTWRAARVTDVPATPPIGN